LLITAIGDFGKAIVNLPIFFQMIKEQLKEVKLILLLSPGSFNLKGGMIM